MLKTVKFGGTSLANAEQFRKCAAIVQAEDTRRYVVVSAPGKRSGDDIKVTDLLYSCYEAAAAGKDFSEPFGVIRNRFAEIICELGLTLSLDDALDQIAYDLKNYPNRDYAASRGEYLSAIVMSAYLGRPMIDTANCIFFDADGNFDGERTQETLSAMLKEIPEAVFPGFYGSMPDGSIRTFSRGGSDIIGAIVARGSASDLYENWTDVSGLLSCDPRIVENPQVIDLISYAELRELAYMGASVLHESAIFPVKAAGIPINIRNTNAPQDAGTMIVPTLPDNVKKHIVTGVAGKKGFSSIQIEKSMMNSQLGFLARVLDIIAVNGVPFEHSPTGIDTLSVIVDTEAFRGKRDPILREIHDRLHPDMVILENGLAMIAVVGQGMVSYKGVAARIFGAIAEAGVNIRMIDQGSSELNIIIGVEEADYEKAIRSIYQAVEKLM